MTSEEESSSVSFCLRCGLWLHHLVTVSLFWVAGLRSVMWGWLNPFSMTVTSLDLYYITYMWDLSCDKAHVTRIIRHQNGKSRPKQMCPSKYTADSNCKHRCLCMRTETQECRDLHRKGLQSTQCIDQTHLNCTMTVDWYCSKVTVN